MTERMTEMQKKIKSELFPFGEVSVLDIQENNLYNRAMCLAYMLKQLTEYREKVAFIYRSTSFPVSFISDWLDYFDVAYSSRNDGYGFHFGDKKVKLIIYESEKSVYDLLNDNAYDLGDATVVGFDITNVEDFRKYSQTMKKMGNYNISLVCVGKENSRLGCEVVKLGETDINVKPLILNKFSVAPFKWKEKDRLNFHNLDSLELKKYATGNSNTEMYSLTPITMLAPPTANPKPNNNSNKQNNKKEKRKSNV